MLKNDTAAVPLQHPEGEELKSVFEGYFSGGFSSPLVLARPLFNVVRR